MPLRDIRHSIVTSTSMNRCAVELGRFKIQHTCLRYGEAREFHQLIDRECSRRHELLVERCSAFGGECLMLTLVLNDRT
jgi:hypothetical protein